MYETILINVVNDYCIRKSRYIETIILRLVEFCSYVAFQSVLLSRDTQLYTDLKGQYFNIF